MTFEIFFYSYFGLLLSVILFSGVAYMKMELILFWHFTTKGLILLPVSLAVLPVADYYLN